MWAFVNLCPSAAAASRRRDPQDLQDGLGRRAPRHELLIGRRDPPAPEGTAAGADRALHESTPRRRVISRKHRHERRSPPYRWDMTNKPFRGYFDCEGGWR